MNENAPKPVTTTVLMPPDLRRWLENYAAKNTRSLSQQVVHLVGEKRAQEEAKAGENA